MHPALRPGAETLTHAVIRIRAGLPPQGAKRPLLSAVLVLDTSRSMTGEPLAQVLQSARRVAEILDDADRLGVVTFSAGATTLAPLVPLAEGRRDLIAALSRVRTQVGTNIQGGLAQAALLFPPRAEGERQVALLMSDGEPSVGAVSPAALGAAARLLRARDVAVSTLGYGAKHNDDILGEVAEGGGGRYTFVIDPRLAEASFVRALGAQLDVVAERVELLLTPGEGVEIIRVLEAPPAAYGPNGLRVTLQDLIAGDELNVVVALRVRAPAEPATFRALGVKLSFAPAGVPAPVEIARSLELLCSGAAAIGTDPAAHAVVSVALAAERRTDARAIADRGAFEQADAILRSAQELLAATPGFVQNDGSALADAHETLADERAMLAQRPDREAYEVHRHAARDHADFAMSGPRSRGSSIPASVSPSSRYLLERARSGQPMPRAFLRVLSGPQAGTRVAIEKERFVIGRAPRTTDLTLTDVDVSRHCAVIEFSGGAFWLVDLGSTNGPMHKGERVTRLRLSAGDDFQIGDNHLRYEEEPQGLLN